jgi:hypothetical protein
VLGPPDITSRATTSGSGLPEHRHRPLDTQQQLLLFEGLGGQLTPVDGINDGLKSSGCFGSVLTPRASNSNNNVRGPREGFSTRSSTINASTSAGI